MARFPTRPTSSSSASTGWLLSVWDEPRRGAEALQRIDGCRTWLNRINQTVQEVSAGHDIAEPMELCRRVVAELGLPPFAANPLVARSFLACLKQE